MIIFLEFLNICFCLNSSLLLDEDNSLSNEYGQKIDTTTYINNMMCENTMISHSCNDCDYCDEEVKCSYLN